MDEDDINNITCIPTFKGRTRARYIGNMCFVAEDLLSPELQEEPQKKAYAISQLLLWPLRHLRRLVRSAIM